MKNQFRYRVFLIALLTFFLCYNFKIYTTSEDFGEIQLSKMGLEGEQLWRKNNCNSCHQLYGLGGYLGPDLTNIYSKPGKGPVQIRAMLNSGVKAMPQFHFNDSEKEALVHFLKEVDQTGSYPNQYARIQLNGWVSSSNQQ